MIKMEPVEHHLYDEQGGPDGLHHERAANLDVMRGVAGTPHAALPDDDSTSQKSAQA